MYVYSSPLCTDLYWKNPQFSVTLRDVDDADNKPTCTVIISLIEKEQNNKSQIAIGFDVYKVELNFVCFCCCCCFFKTIISQILIIITKINTLSAVRNETKLSVLKH